jgi:moderate conductance mechanosensitive channel
MTTAFIQSSYQGIDRVLLLRLGIILLYFVIAFVISRLARPVARRLVRLRGLVPKNRQPSAERALTLEGLLSSAIALLAFAIALIAMIALFVQADTLLWVVGLFSAAFGWGARSLVSDVLSGGGFIFRNTFDIGEKVELNIGMEKIEGVIEQVNVIDTLVRSPTGELFTVPNGEIRLIRNFSRSAFSSGRITFFIPTRDLMRVEQTLHELGQEIVLLVPDILEPWQVITTEERIGQKTQIMLVIRMTFGKAATAKLKAIDLLFERLGKDEIEILD